MASSLADLSIVITRPAHQAAALQNMLNELGARTILFPCIDIKPVLINEIAIPLSEVDIFIFISPNSVEYGFQAMPKLLNQAASNSQIAAVGQATAKALKAKDLDQVITPADLWLLVLWRPRKYSQEAESRGKGEGSVRRVGRWDDREKLIIILILS